MNNLYGIITDKGSMDATLDIPIFKKEKYTPSYILFRSFPGTNLDYEIENLSTANMTSMRLMFSLMSNITELNLSTFDTSKVTDMYEMFLTSTKLKTINISGFDTSNVTNFASIFENCYALENIVGIDKLNMESATKMSGMFKNCSRIVEINISKWNCSHCYNVGDLFQYCTGLSENSLHSIIIMCLTLPTRHTLEQIGLNQAQTTTCTTFPEWQELVTKGWTTGY